MRSYLASLAIALTMIVPVIAQQANLNGTWKLNLGTSFMAGDHTGPDYEFTKVLTQKGRTIHQTDIAKHVSIMNIPLPDTNIKTNLTIDGQEQGIEAPPVFPGMPPAKLKVIAEWQGNTLLVMERNAGAGPASSTKRRYFLSEDGAHLIELIEAHNGFGDTEQRLVFDKQPGS
jgi:hypothetical protein